MGKRNYGCCFFEKKSLNNFSIIIPVYNEADNINSLYAEIIESIPKNFNYEIIFINDHSTDDTNIVKNFISTCPSRVQQIRKRKCGFRC